MRDVRTYVGITAGQRSDPLVAGIYLGGEAARLISTIGRNVWKTRATPKNRGAQQRLFDSPERIATAHAQAFVRGDLVSFIGFFLKKWRDTPQIIHIAPAAIRSQPSIHAANIQNIWRWDCSRR